ncbi:hypothetical protein [Spirochaeta dissipatitropha]
MSTLYSLLVSLTVTFGMSIVLLRRIEVKTRSRKMMDELRSEIGGVIVEMNASTDRNIQLIEDRIQQLKEIIATADSRIQLLNAELAKAKKGDELYVQLRGSKRGAPMTTTAAVEKKTDQSSDTPPDTSEASSADVPDPASIEDAADVSNSTADSTASSDVGVVRGTESIAVSASDSGPDSASKGNPAPEDSGGSLQQVAGQPASDRPSTGQDAAGQQPAGQTPLRMRVWEMYAAGEKIERIAARIGRTEGEVELMISLLPKDET